MISCPLASPCRITQRFGERPDVYGQFGLKGHEGIDLAGPVPGQLVSIYAPYDGVIYEVGDQGKKGYGKFIRLRTFPSKNGQKRELVFGHLSVIGVKLGDEVRFGDSIGIMGSTGFATAPHLHFGLRRIDAAGKVIDYGNGFTGYVDFLDYLIPYVPDWKTRKPPLISLP
jgi:murein DD-endopeptidase MepM/ murein hydrolase activator NlpD